MTHFIVGVILAAVTAAITHHVWHDSLVTLVAGVAVAVIYWLIVGIIKGYINLRDIDLDFDLDL